jgi:hypothetical protein
MIGQVKRNEMGRACSRLGEVRNAFNILFEKPEGERLLSEMGGQYSVDVVEIGGRL